MPWILHALSEWLDQVKFLPCSTRLVFHMIQPRKAYSDHKGALVLLQSVPTNPNKTSALQWEERFQMCIGEIQSKWKIAGTEVNSDLPSAFTGCTELVLSHLFCSKERHFLYNKCLKAGKKAGVVLSCCAPQKASAVTEQAEGLLLKGRNNGGGKREAENIREMQRISQSSL